MHNVMLSLRHSCVRQFELLLPTPLSFFSERNIKEFNNYFVREKIWKKQEAGLKNHCLIFDPISFPRTLHLIRRSVNAVAHTVTQRETLVQSLVTFINPAAPPAPPPQPSM